ncbi:MAG TPA: amino acid adenylation domain-containing protein, partial [Steroidobacteraceae bacterium]|nr:amino acid adenylation domain-containing protein [Steroidobacteraceae bacterium]
RSDVPDLPLQYRHFSRWQRENGRVEEHVRVWSEKLRTANHVLGIGDRQRPNVPSRRSFSVPISVPARLKESILACGRRSGASAFMTLLATYAIMLSRYANQNEMLIGSSIQNRSRPELRNLIGYFLNTILLKVAVDEKLSFNEIVVRARDACTEAYAFDDAPFHRIVEEINPPRDKSITPLFQAMFVMQVAGANRFALPGIEIEQISSYKFDIKQLERAEPAEGSPHSGPPDELVSFEGGSKYDIYLHLLDEGEGRPLEGWLACSSDIFGRETAANWLANYAALLERIVNEPNTPLWKLADLCARDRVTVTQRGNERNVGAKSLVTQFERQVDRNPHGTALINEGKTLSFLQLNRLANGIASRLRDEGVEPGEFIGLCMDRSPEMIASILAALKLGAAYVPLDPALPDERIRHYIQATPKLIVAATNAWPRFAEYAGKLVDLERWLGASDVGNYDENPPRKDHAESVAYVLFTSGSTGSPKAVMATHGATLNRIFWGHREMPCAADDVFCHKTTCSFVDHVAEIFEPLLRGNPVLVVPQNKVLDVVEFVRILGEHRVSQLTLVPSFLLTLIDQYPELGKTLPSLRRVICSGEALQPELASRFHRALPGAELLNVYGSTEVGADVSYYRVPATICATESVPIGQPLDNSVVYVLDRYLNRCPAGVAGEAFIGGAQVAQGYFRDPALTAASFLPDPFLGDGARMFRTRDLARYSHGGEIEYLGRNDNQVKVRGFRINLDEVQRILLAHPNVKDAVAGVHVEQNDTRLVAYVVLDDARLYEFDRSALRVFLSTRLPDYMVPSVFVVLENLPLTSNGKVNRKALPAPDAAVSELSYVPPEGETEVALARIWQELLNVKRVGRQDNFYSLGGHSLLAVRLSSRVSKELGVELRIPAIFNEPTLAALAQYLERNTSIGARGALEEGVIE